MAAHLILHAAPAAGFDEPFEMLLACHQRVERMLVLLQRLAEHLQHKAADADAQQAATDVARYFDLAGPAHHQDEERHLFPALQAGGDVALLSLVAGLQQDHRAMEAQWLAVRADLAAVQAGALPPALAASRWAAFAGLYRRHVALEESLAYPAARPLLGPDQRVAMGFEMAQRRGARLPPLAAGAAGPGGPG